MAKVISWAVQKGGETRYVYINNPSVLRTDRITDRATLSSIAQISQGTYQTNFATVYNTIKNYAGTDSISLINDWSQYWNALGSDASIVLLAGLDGRNTSEDNKPYYTLHFSNQVIGVGLGGDNILDNTARTKSFIYFERNGVEYLPTSITSDNAFVSAGSHTDKEYEIVISSGLEFQVNGDVLLPVEVKFTVYKDDFSAQCLFTILPVKNGVDGDTYNLVVVPKQVKVASDDVFNGEVVKCYATVNGEDIAYGSNQKYNIRYNFGYETITDAESLVSATEQYTSDGFVLSSDNINNIDDDTINFYFIYNKGTTESPRWILLDYDSCLIMRDGKNGVGYVKLELDNEVDGVVIGDDTDLDLESGETVDLHVGFRLFRGSEKLNINTLTVTFPGDDEVTFEGRNSNGPFKHTDTYYDIDAEEGTLGFETLYFTLKDQFDFGEDRRVSVHIKAVNNDNEEQPVVGEANYIILGVRGGKDGVVYKLVPSTDYIIYDPNTDKANPPLTEKVTCVAYLGTDLIENANIKYSFDTVYNTESQILGLDTLPAEGIPVEDIAKGDPNSTEDDEINHSITFYLISDDQQFVDRETVPVIRGGLDGVAVRLELGNELDAVSVGDDTDLDLEDDVVVRCGTSVRVLFGQDPMTIKTIVAKPEKSGDTTIDALWDDPNIVDIKYGFVQETDGQDVFHPTDGNIMRTNCYVQVNLKNGFEFGKDRRERLKIIVTYLDSAGAEKVISGYYVLIGVKGGKDGAMFKIMPDRDYIRYYADQGVYDTGTDMFGCRAYYGADLIAGDGAVGGTEPEAKLLVLNYVKKIETFTPAEIEGGALDYPMGGVDVDDYRLGPESTNMIVFYLAVKLEDVWTIVDRESVPIISDGVDGADNLKVELDNEIEPITIGTGDQTLDIGENESVLAGTGARLMIGRDPQEIATCELDFSDFGSNTLQTHYTYKVYDSAGNVKLNNTTSGSIDGDTQITLEITLKNQFNFGSNYKRRVIITLTSVDGERARAVFFLVGLRFGKDGATYRAMPNPDYVLYDYEAGRFINGMHVTCRALCNGMLMQSGTYKIFYTHTYPGASSDDTIYDIMTDDLYTIATTHSNYFVELPEGGSVPFQTPDTNVKRSQVIVFYMFIKSGEGENDWTCVDRESVPLVLNGKIGAQGAPGRDGNDGEGTSTFDLLNPKDTVTTGSDHILDLPEGEYITVGTEARFCSGQTELTCIIDNCVSVQDISHNQGKYTLSYVGGTSTRPKLEIKLYNGFEFGTDWRFDFDLTLKHGTITDTRRYTLNAIANGVEGAMYNIKTNAGTIVYDPKLDKYFPQTITGDLYLNTDKQKNGYDSSTPGAAKCYLKYQAYARTEDSRGNPVETPITEETNFTGSLNTRDVFVRDGNQIISGVIYLRAYLNESDVNDIDFTDIPLVSNGLDGSGTLFDLANEFDMIALGEDKILDLDENEERKFSTHGELYSGSEQLSITGATVTTDAPSTVTVHWVNSLNTQIATGNHIYVHSALTTDYSQDSSDYGFFMEMEIGNQFDFGILNNMSINFTINVATEGNQNKRSAVYTLMGLKGGKDGYVFKILPSHNTIKILDDGRYKPLDGLSATTMYGTIDVKDDADLRPQFRMFYACNDGDWQSYTMGTVLNLNTIQPIDFLSFKTEFNVGTTETPRWVLVDREDIPVLRDGIDGIGSIIWSLTDYEVTVGTGGDRQLNIPNTQHYNCVTTATAESGDTYLTFKVSVALKDGQISDFNDKLHVHYNENVYDDNHDIQITLDDGFMFPDTMKLDFYINFETEANATQGPARTRTLIYSIIGVPAGADGLGFKLVTNTRTVVYDANADELYPSEITAEMYLGPEVFTRATIKYDVLYGAQTLLQNQTYSGPLNVRSILTENGEMRTPAKFVFSATGNSGDYNGVHLDKTDVAVVPSGKNSSGIIADLDNDYDYISLGEDKILGNEVQGTGDIEIPENYAKLYNGENPLEITTAVITAYTGDFGTDTTSGKDGVWAYYQQTNGGVTSRIKAKIEPMPGDDKRAKVTVLAGRGFDFGKLYNMSVSFLITVSDADGKSQSIKYSLIGVLGGRDGYIWKLEPTVGSVVYDYEYSDWDPDTINATLKYGPDELTDAELAAKSITIFYQDGRFDPSVALSVIPSGGIDTSTIHSRWITFVAISGSTSVGHTIVDGTDVILDVESVPVVNSGVIGKSGVVFDLTNENDSVTTGDNSILDIDDPDGVECYTDVVCRVGYDDYPVLLYKGNNPYTSEDHTSGATDEHYKIIVEQAGDTTQHNLENPRFTVIFYNGYDFGEDDMKVEFPITAKTTVDTVEVKQTLVFTVTAVANGSEGKRFTLRPTTTCIVYDVNTDTYNGSQSLGVLAELYLNEDLIPVKDGSTTNYCVTAKLSNGLSSELPMTYNTSNRVYQLFVPDFFTTGGSSLTDVYNCTLTLTAYSGSTASGTYLDHCDIPIVSNGRDGSGIVADLSNERDIIYLGKDDSVLDNKETFNSTLTVWSGTTKLTIQKVNLSILDDPNSAIYNQISSLSGGQLKTDVGQNGTNPQDSATLTLTIPSGFNFSACTNNKVAVKMLATMQDTAIGQIEKVFTVTGIEGGQDGQSVRLLVRPSAVFKTDSGYLPSSVRVQIISNPELDQSEKGNYRLFYGIDDENPSTFDSTNAYGNGVVISLEEDPYHLPTRQVTLYMTENVNSYWSTCKDYVLDAENIPILTQGENGKGGVGLFFEPAFKFVGSTANDTGVTYSPSEVTLNMIARVGDEEYTVTSADVTIEKKANGNKNLGVLVPGNSYNANTSKHTIPSGDVTVSNGQLTVDYPELALTTAQINDGVVFTVVGHITYEGESVEIKGSFTLYPDQIFASGSQGARGPKTRIREWKESGYTATAGTNIYQDGSEGDEFWDIVFYQDGDFAGYFGCINDHDPSSTKKPFVPQDVTVSESNTYWQYYPSYDFLATKVITIGEGLDGWVIDKGKIQHMASGVTLTSDGTVEVAETGGTYYRWNRTSDIGVQLGYNSPVYTKNNYRTNSTLFNRDKGKTVTIYEKVGDNMTLYRQDLLLSGTSSSPTLYVPATEANNVSLSLYPTSSGIGNVKSSVLLSNEFTFKIKCFMTLVTVQRDIRYGSDDGNIYYRAQALFYSGGTASATLGETRLAGSLTYTAGTQTTLSNYFGGSNGMSGSTALSTVKSNADSWAKSQMDAALTSLKAGGDGTPRYSSANPIVGSENIVVDDGSSGLRFSERVPAVDEEDPVFDDPGGGGGGGNLIIQDTGWLSYQSYTIVAFVEIPTSSSVSTYEGEENLYFDRTASRSQCGGYGAGEYFSVVHPSYQTGFDEDFFASDGGVATGIYGNAYRADATTNSALTIAHSKKLAMLNSTDEGASENFGKVCFAAGIFEGTLYRWVNGGSTIYTMKQYSPANTSAGEGVTVYPMTITNGVLMETDAVVAHNGTFNIDYVDNNAVGRIEFENKNYSYSTSVSFTDPDQLKNLEKSLAKTRIYADGKIVADEVYVSNGVFNGTVNATNGVFTGEVNAKSGVFTNVRITSGSTFSGNIDLIGGNTISVYEDGTNIPRVSISSTKLNTNQSTYAIPFAGYSHYRVNTDTLGRLSDSFNTVLISEPVSAGATITIPSFTITWDIHRPVEFGFTAYYMLGSTKTALKTLSISDSQSGNYTGSKTISVSSDTEFKLGISMWYTLKTNNVPFAGKPTVNFNWTMSGSISVQNASGNLVRQVRIGPNGLAYVDGLGGEMFAITSGSRTAMGMRTKNGYSTSSKTYYNGFYVDNDDVRIYIAQKYLKLDFSNEVVQWLSQ